MRGVFVGARRNRRCFRLADHVGHGAVSAWKSGIFANCCVRALCEFLNLRFIARLSPIGRTILMLLLAGARRLRERRSR